MIKVVGTGKCLHRFPSGHYILVVKVTDQEWKVPDSNPGIMSLGKAFMTYFPLAGLLLVTVTRCAMRKDTCVWLLELSKSPREKIQKYSDVNLEV